MGIFEKKKALERGKIRERIRKTPSRIPGYFREKRLKIIKEAFPWKRFGSHLSEREFNRRIRELQIEKGRARTSAERLKKERLIRYLKELKE